MQTNIHARNKYLQPFKCAQKLAQVRLKKLSTKCVYKSYIYIYIGFGIK